MQAPPANLLETAIGGFMQDIGKFMQRAFRTVRAMDPQPRARESVILPTDGRGGYTHKHVLWTEAFFHWMEHEGLAFPTGVNRDRVRDMAVFHHKPDANGAAGWLAAEADRLSSGMDRKPQDEQCEQDADVPKGWDAFIRTPMLSPFVPVNLGLGEAPRRFQPLTELTPDDALMPSERVNIETYPKRYEELWTAFTAEFARLCREVADPRLFCEGLLSLSERYTFAIPSSTVDLPDISLHDHNRTVAAIAACLQAWHAVDGSLADEVRVRDRAQPKFRLLAGDLSGIQHTLFLLAHQQVKGVNKILRARSFLMGATLEAAALQVRETLELTPFQLIQNAGGRFVMLVPDVPGLDARVAELRACFDRWMRTRYLGELTLNLALGCPFGGQGLLPGSFRAVQADLERCLEAAKLSALSDATGVLPVEFPHGVCPACDRRPAAKQAGRCSVCEDEHRVGGWLPKTQTALWHWQPRARMGDWAVRFFDEPSGGLSLVLYDDVPPIAGTAALSGYRFRAAVTDPAAASWPLRCVANHIPRLRGDEDYSAEDREDAEDVEPGEPKTLGMLAADALERFNGERRGRKFLAVLKADVDRLGMVFSDGLRDANAARDRNSLSRFAALSRMLDLFFTGYLQTLIRRDFPDIYTVYAGGDDLLLIGPWRQTVDFMQAMNAAFRTYTGSNPNLTLSAGLALVRANQPLNRAVWEAEERLERAKNERDPAGKDIGRNRCCLIEDISHTWDELPDLLAEGRQLNDWLRAGTVNSAHLFRLLDFGAQRERAEVPDENGSLDLAATNWRARWAYHLARNVRGGQQVPSQHKAEVSELFNRLLGLSERLGKSTRRSPRIPVSLALYRNRG